MMNLKMPLVLILTFFSTVFGFAGEKVNLDAPEIFHVEGEVTTLNKKPAKRWAGGTALRQLYCKRPRKSTAVAGALRPGSVIVRKGNETLTRGQDYELDETWASLWIPEGSTLTTKDKVTVDYSYSVLRIDSKIQTHDGKTIIRKGVSHLTMPHMPELKQGEKRLCNYLINYDGSVDEYPLVKDILDNSQTTGPELLPLTVEKLKNGESVKIVCWGDSVTFGGDSSSPEHAYASVFEKMLRAKFPKANINVVIVAVGGSSTLNWLYPEKYPRRGCDFQRVLDEKPDLITLEFVNDAYMNKHSFDVHYNEALKRLEKTGAELIFITPHFTRPDMMKFNDGKREESREYVVCLKDFAKANSIAIADASARWEHLAFEGIPYMTLLNNGINHPDDRGHKIFAEELIRCFTGKK